MMSPVVDVGSTRIGLINKRKDVESDEFGLVGKIKGNHFFFFFKNE